MKRFKWMAVSAAAFVAVSASAGTVTWTADDLEQTVANLREVAPTVYLNVPRGFADLVPYFRREPASLEQGLDFAQRAVRVRAVRRRNVEVIAAQSVILGRLQGHFHGRQRGAERAVEQDLLRRVRDVVVTAHHVRDAHGDVVGHHGHVVDRRAVRPEDHEVVEVLVREGNLAVDEVGPSRRALGHAESDRVRLARGDAARDGPHLRHLLELS